MLLGDDMANRHQVLRMGGLSGCLQLGGVGGERGMRQGGFRILLTDRSKLVMTIGGVTALAAGVYTTRKGAKVMWGYVNRILGQPSLIRESSMAKFPWSGIISRGSNKMLHYSTISRAAAPAQNKSAFRDNILHPSLQKRIDHLARATANTKTHQAPFRNMLFHGPPGTGKTMVARVIARKSGLDYAKMTGGDGCTAGSTGCYQNP
ncbi:AAA-type ATPase family protein [Abeliophyllum distichum]|uniref:AAA-type ATPase family protein n=1 Tax=Abeliophyllum distichum TaxID=126358 RepID=A0ABD1V7N6_9LAMI